MAILSFEEFIKKIDQLEEANILIAALEFRVFTHLGKRGLTSTTLAKRAGINTEGAEALLNALVSLGALRKLKNSYTNTSESFKHFCEHSPQYKRGTIFLRKENRNEWSRLIDVLSNGRDMTSEDDPDFRTPFTHAMHERSMVYATPLTQFITRKQVGKMLDIGGGPGSYSAHILKFDRTAKCTLIDRPASLEVAKSLLAKSPVLTRFDFVPGDLFTVNFAKQTDTVLYSNILHIYNESENSRLFKKIYQSLKPGGRFILVDLFLKDNRTVPRDAAMFSLTMLLFTNTGKTYTFQETKRLLKKNGFGKFEYCKLGQGTSVIEAVKI